MSANDGASVSTVLCKFCIVERGVTLDDVLDGEEALIAHLEAEHDIAIQRDGETEAQAWARLRVTNPRAGGPDCHCPSCRSRRN